MGPTWYYTIFVSGKQLPNMHTHMQQKHKRITTIVQTFKNNANGNAKHANTCNTNATLMTTNAQALKQMQTKWQNMSRNATKMQNNYKQL